MQRFLQACALLVFLTFAFYWKITLTSQYDWMWGPDLAGQVLPWFQAQARDWHGFSFPLWDEHLWYGQPFFGQAQPGSAYPLNWLLFWMPFGKTGHISLDVLGFYFVIIHLMAAGFCYWLCRDIGLSHVASLLSGIVFSTAGYIGGTDWPQMINGAVWLPLVFLFLFRSTGVGPCFPNAALAGVCLGASWLSGHHQAPMFVTLASAGAWTYFTFRKGRVNWAVVRAAAVCMLIAGLCGSLQILPAIEYGQLAKRWVGTPYPVSWHDRVPYYIHEAHSLPPFSIFGILFPGFREVLDPFLGVVAVGLAVFAVMEDWEDSRVRVLLGLATGGLAYSLGGASIFEGILYAILPSLDKSRTPAAAVSIFGFGIAVLAGWGANQWLVKPSSGRTRRLAIALTGFGVITVAVDWAALVQNKLSYPAEQRSILTALIALALAALLLATRTAKLTTRGAGVLLLTLALFETYQGSTMLAAMARRGDVDRDHTRLSLIANEDIAEYLRRQPGMQRTEIATDSIPASWGEWHDVPTFEGYLASVTSNIFSFNFASDESKRLWGVAYVLAPGPMLNAGEPVFVGKSGVKVYRRPGVFPRAWVVHRLTRLPDGANIDSYLAGQLEDLHSVAITSKEPAALSSCGEPKLAETADLLEDRGNEVKIKVHLDCQGLVVLSDTFFPGWHAYVDGAPARIDTVNGAMRAVQSPAGDHLMTMRYRPISVYAGGILTLLGLLAAWLTCRLARRIVAKGA